MSHKHLSIAAIAISLASLSFSLSVFTNQQFASAQTGTGEDSGRTGSNMTGTQNTGSDFGSLFSSGCVNLISAINRSGDVVTGNVPCVVVTSCENYLLTGARGAIVNVFGVPCDTGGYGYGYNSFFGRGFGYGWKTSAYFYLERPLVLIAKSMVQKLQKSKALTKLPKNFKVDNLFSAKEWKNMKAEVAKDITQRRKIFGGIQAGARTRLYNDFLRILKTKK